jgi:hypothetical protein
MPHDLLPYLPCPFYHSRCRRPRLTSPSRARTAAGPACPRPSPSIGLGAPLLSQSHSQCLSKRLWLCSTLPFTLPCHCSRTRVHVEPRPPDFEASSEFSGALAGKDGIRQGRNVLHRLPAFYHSKHELTIAKFSRRPRHWRWTDGSRSSKAPSPDCKFWTSCIHGGAAANTLRTAPHGSLLIQMRHQVVWLRPTLPQRAS